MIEIKIMYAANVILAGWVGISSFFFPKYAQSTVFENAFEYSESIRLVGALWTSILILSCIGLFLPEEMSLVLLFQLIYKGSWLLVVVLPALIIGSPFPKSMALFFLIWVIILPFVIPWKIIF